MLENARILVVDDERIIREGCARLLTKAGHVVETYTNGREALDQIKRREYDMVLLDIKMPQMDGMQFMDALRRDRTDLIILVITGYASIEVAVEAMKAGAYDLLIKPFSADALRIAVDRALDHLRLAYEAEQLRAERAKNLIDVANEQSRMATIMDSMACGILVTDHQKNLALCNPLLPQMLDIPAAGLVGRPVADVLPKKKLIEMVDRIFSESQNITALEEEIEVGGQWLRARTAPVLDSDSHVMGTVTVLQDITYLKEMDRMKSEFVTMVSHELKAPLAAIQQQLEVLLEGIVGELNERQTHFLTRARTRAQRLVELINQMLDLSRIEAGRSRLQAEPTDLAPIIRHVVEFVKPQADGKSQILTCDVPDALPLVSADPEAMDEVVMNLVNNAIKYSPDRAEITVRAEASANYLSIFVIDTGYGIPKADQVKIFDKFYRSKSKETKDISGTGLGLPIVWGIVESHRGRVMLASEVGQGTTFKVELPLLKRTPA